jgi:CBS domain-containing protein
MNDPVGGGITMNDGGQLRQGFDLREAVYRYPWLTVGGSVAAGFLVGSVAAAGARRQGGWGLGQTFGEEFRQVKELAVGALGALAQEWLKEAVPGSLGPQFKELVESFTRKLGGTPVEGLRFPGGWQGGSHQGGSASGSGLRVRDVMTRDPVCCTRDTSLTDVARVITEHNCGAIPVVQSNDNGKLVGIVTDRDIVTRTLAAGKDPYHLTAGDCMSADVRTVSPDASLDECARLMERHQVRRILVMDRSGRVCGVVAQADLARHAPRHQAGEVVKEVSQPSAFGSRRW